MLLYLVQRCLNNSEIQCLIFVTGQGGGRRQCGGIVDWRQRRTGANSRCCIHCYLRNAVLAICWQHFFMPVLNRCLIFCYLFIICLTIQSHFQKLLYYI